MQARARKADNHSQRVGGGDDDGSQQSDGAGVALSIEGLGHGHTEEDVVGPDDGLPNGGRLVVVRHQPGGNQEGKEKHQQQSGHGEGDLPALHAVPHGGIVDIFEEQNGHK